VLAGRHDNSQRTGWRRVRTFAVFPDGRRSPTEETDAMKNCKLCGLSKFCNDLPGVCISLQMVAVLTVVGVITYLFVTQELLG